MTFSIRLRSSLSAVNSGTKVACLLVLAASLLGGCGSCTLADCYESISLSVSHPLPVGKYQLEVTTSSEEAANCDIDVAPEVANSSNWTIRHCTGELHIEVWGESISIRGAPSRISVSLTSSETGGSVSESYTPSYELFSPNGAGCGPDCRNAQETFDSRQLADSQVTELGAVER